MTCQAYGAVPANPLPAARLTPRLRGMRASRAWLACLLLLLTLGCQADSNDDLPAVTPSRSGPAGMDASLREAALALVDEREEALRSGDRDAFLATVDPDELAFSSTQARWFDNLAQLPVTDVSYELGDESVMTQVAGDGDLQLPVDFTMRMRGFDRHPVTQRMVWTFVRDGDDALLADDRNVQIEAKTGWTPAPWDLTRIEVRHVGGILAIFDKETVDNADYVMEDLVDATEVVSRHVPPWSEHFIAYGTSDVSAIDEMSAMDVEDTAGVAFPVLAREGGPVAAYRFMVNPNLIGDVLSRGRGVPPRAGARRARHRGRPLPRLVGRGRSGVRRPHDAPRRLPAADRGRAAVPDRGAHARAQRSVLHPRPALNYELASLVCDYLATTRGEDALWGLVRTFRTARFSAWAETEGIVRRELGMSTRELSRQALAWARAA